MRWAHPSASVESWSPLVQSLRSLCARGRLVVASSQPELRVAARRGYAIDAHAVAELMLAARALDTAGARGPAQRKAA